MINYEIENELKDNLISGEKLIWAGQPKTGIMITRSDAFLIPFSLVWCGCAIFWEWTAFVTGAPLFLKLWGIPFILCGLYLVTGRFYIDARKRAKTIYGITNERIIIKSGIFNQEIKSLNIKTISDVTMNEKADNSGTITLGPADFKYARMQGIELPGVKQVLRLELIEDVKSVYNKIIALQKER